MMAALPVTRIPERRRRLRKRKKQQVDPFQAEQPADDPEEITSQSQSQSQSQHTQQRRRVVKKRKNRARPTRVYSPLKIGSATRSVVCTETDVVTEDIPTKKRRVVSRNLDFEAEVLDETEDEAAAQEEEQKEVIILEEQADREEQYEEDEEEEQERVVVQQEEEEEEEEPDDEPEEADEEQEEFSDEDQEGYHQPPPQRARTWRKPSPEQKELTTHRPRRQEPEIEVRIPRSDSSSRNPRQLYNGCDPRHMLAKRFGRNIQYELQRAHFGPLSLYMETTRRKQIRLIAVMDIGGRVRLGALTRLYRKIDDYHRRNGIKLHDVVLQNGCVLHIDFNTT